MEFGSGDIVEVCSKEEGFQGSYYRATIMKKLDANSYQVKYRRLVEEDGSTPLTETVRVDEVRPVPTKVGVKGGFRLYDKVDAFDNDGWWVGKITGKRGSTYYVYFDSCKVEQPFDKNMLRVHQDWVNGHWFI